MDDLTFKTDYSYTQTLKKGQWAWEFLRRNAAYQNDYQWFIAQWKALENDYGCSTDKDYQAWKQDPRSYKIIDISSDQDGNCAISDDKLLIECWMGNKWGFYQFPQSPQLNALEVDINWRPLPPEYKAPDNPSEVNKNQLIQTMDFDLSKSLKEQLEQVKRKIIIAQRRLRKQGSLTPFTIMGKRELWMCCLSWLDSQDKVDNEYQYSFDKMQIKIEAEYYLCHYLNILTLMEK